MMNSLILAASLIFIFSAVIAAYYLFGKAGLFCVSATATVLANIEVVMMIRAFGMEQTLGNVLFAATFLVTDILSECEGKKEANKAVRIGIFSSVFFLVLSQSWLLYTPSVNVEGAKSVHDAFSAVFSQTPRVVLASLSVYAVCQFFDVWIYHKWWDFTSEKTGSKRRLLWLRNNGSTLISQILNALLFTLFAFAGTCDASTLVSIFLSSYIIYVFTSLLDTPVLYIARHIHDKKHLQ